MQPSLSVKVWRFQSAIVELYRYAPGPQDVVPTHCHEEYQLALCVDFPGEYRYRGITYPTPVGSLSVIHPGEPHSARDPVERSRSATFRMMYLHPASLTSVAADMVGREVGLPYIQTPVIVDEELVRACLSLHQAVEGEVPLLEQDVRMLDALTLLMVRYAESSPRLATLRRARPEVEQVRDHLRNGYAENVRLSELAQLAGLSPFHLCQAFRQEFGMPPHYYQTQHRIDRARKLLLEGRPVAEVALETGFYDQSHFTRRFKRFVGVTPARYRLHHRNMQDAQRGRG